MIHFAFVITNILLRVSNLSCYGSGRPNYELKVKCAYRMKEKCIILNSFRSKFNNFAIFYQHWTHWSAFFDRLRTMHFVGLALAEHTVQRLRNALSQVGFSRTHCTNSVSSNWYITFCDPSTWQMTLKKYSLPLDLWYILQCITIKQNGFVSLF